MKKYIRNSFEVEAIAYELGKGLEDGFMPWNSIVTTGWIRTDKLIQVTREDGMVVCPFIQNRRELFSCGKGDYIITETDQERHACGGDKFFDRYQPIDES